jgi:signal transduction histidine kinase/DNA-binding NarL/FixJ family response regulator
MKGAKDHRGTDRGRRRGSRRPSEGASARAEQQEWLAAAGETGALIRSMDWSSTPLGPLRSWTQSLRSAVGICLGSRFPIVLYWGPDRVVLYNDSYAEILGKKHPWALGRPCREVWSEIWDVIAPMLDGVMSRGEATWSDDQVLFLERRGYREECYFSFSFSPVHGAGGDVEGIFTAVIETTRRVLGERRLRTLRDLAARAAIAKDEMQTWKSAAEALANNPQDVEFALLYRTDAVGDSARLVATAGPEGGPPGAPAVLDLASAPEDLWPGESPAAAVLPVSRPGAPPYGYLIVGLGPSRPLDDEYRGFLELVAEHVATGVANARAHEEERRRAEALAEVDRAKTAFFSNVSHEFRTPLTLMLAPLEDVLAKPPGQDLAGERDLLAVVHRNALRLQKLVNTLLDFSRIEAGRLEAVYEPTELGALTAELASNFRSACERAGLRLLVDCPPLAEAAYVDREMWEKIVLNLLSNAFKFTFAGEIALALRLTQDAFELTVRDTGTGIPAEEIPHLFERFHRVKGVRSRTHEGTGIGLALVQELVELHGGAIGVQSMPDAGSTFTLSIPRGNAHLPADRIGATRTLTSTVLGGAHYAEESLRWLPEPASSAPAPSGGRSGPAASSGEVTLPEIPAGAATADHQPPRILWADDNADMRNYVRRLLAGRYDVHAVADGQAALAAARHSPPELVLADVMMPGLDGFALLRELRADPRTRELPVVLLSARAGEESRVEGLAAGADDYLIKPFSARELLARVEAHLRMARFRREANEALRERQGLLTAEAEALGRLNDASSRLWRLRSLPEGLDEMLGATIQLLGADMGNVQLLDRQRNVLVIAAQRGFAPPFLEFFPGGVRRGRIGVWPGAARRRADRDRRRRR